MDKIFGIPPFPHYNDIFTSRFIEISGCRYVKTKKILYIGGRVFINCWMDQLYMSMIVVEVNLRNLIEIDKALRERAQSSDLYIRTNFVPNLINLCKVFGNISGSTIQIMFIFGAKQPYRTAEEN